MHLINAPEFLKDELICSLYSMLMRSDLCFVTSNHIEAEITYTEPGEGDTVTNLKPATIDTGERECLHSLILGDFIKVDTKQRIHRES